MVAACGTACHQATKTVRTCLEMPEGARGLGGGGGSIIAVGSDRSRLLLNWGERQKTVARLVA